MWLNAEVIDCDAEVEWWWIDGETEEKKGVSVSVTDLIVSVKDSDGDLFLFFLSNMSSLRPSFCLPSLSPPVCSPIFELKQAPDVSDLLGFTQIWASAVGGRKTPSLKGTDDILGVFKQVNYNSTG